MDASLPRAKSSRKLGRGAKFMIGTVTGLLALAAALDYTVTKRNELPNITIPASPEPKPNARTFFLAAAGAIQDSKSVDAAISNPPQTKNAASPHFSRAADKTHIYTLAEKTKLVRENQKSLALLREGFSYSYGSRPYRSINDTFPEFAKCRQMARLLTLESQVKEARGDWNAAMNSELDAVELGVMMPRNGALIADLVGVACEAIGRRRMWDDYKRLNAAQSLAALRRLEKIEGKRFQYADTMEEEKRFGQAALLEAFRSSEGVPVNELADLDNSEGKPETPLQKWAWKTQVTLTGKRVIFENYTRYMNQIVEDARKPYGLHLPPPPAPTDPVNQISAGIFDIARLKPAQSETENHLLAVSLALQIYRQSHGAYPQSLDAVKANVPASLLADPFAAQGNLRYRRDGAKYVLYSVGPDGRDDGGKPIYDKTKIITDKEGERARYRADQNSVGDVVAGVNQ